MCSIPHTRRVNGRYLYRRRVHFQNIISKHITIALRTASPSAARRLATMLSARFMMVKAKVEIMLETGPALTGEQIEEVFRHALEEELNGLLNDTYANAPWSDSVPDVAASIAEACRTLRKPNRPQSPQSSRRDASPEPGENSHLSGADFYAAQILANLGDEQVAAILHAIGASVTAANLGSARTHIIRGMGKGADLAQRAFDEDVLDAPDPAAALTADLGLRPARPVTQILQAPTDTILAWANSRNQESPFVTYEIRRFSEVINEIIDELKGERIWNGD